MLLMTDIVECFLVLCMIFMSEFAANMNLEIIFYKTMNEVEINYQKTSKKGCSVTTFFENILYFYSIKNIFAFV